MGLGGGPGLYALDRVHRPLGPAHAIENHETPDGLRPVGDHQLRGGRSHVVGDDHRAGGIQSLEEREHPSRLARHVDTDANRCL